jgi:hypothetical protein
MQARAKLIAVVAGAATMALPASASAGHGLEMLLDHPAPSFAPAAPLSSTANSGGPDASWELLTTIPTGNPHTDADFFTRGGETYVAVGTLGIGPNGGGQSIVRLTQGGEVDPEFLAGHPSASCLSDPSAATGLQHDVEATPKGNTILNTGNSFADRSDTQLLIDATDAPGRCHDQGELGLAGAPQGGLEIVDVTNPGAPKEIGLVSHIGEAHTVNIDPKRPHIAYAVSSDAVGVNEDRSRQNEDPTDSDRFNLDGFEVVDLSSCMNFPPETTIEQKREGCRPQVYRYRYASADVVLGHTLQNTIYACHELEVYPDDRLTCASGAALAVFDMSGAFDDNGTPTDFGDDKPKGAPLPCSIRGSSSAPPFTSGAKVTDCVDGTGGAVGGVDATEDLTIPGWLASGAPSLEGVSHLGSIHHQGRGAGGAATPAFDSTEDIDFNHEAELSTSGNLLIATDERGGGIVPPGATCTPGPDNVIGNGGVHFYRGDAVHGGGPRSPEQEFEAYARTPDGEKAIFRAPVRTQARATVCTAHVFHQFPGENRIFMGWYSQGTHVIDFLERPDGGVEFQEAGWWIPENANQWVSAAFKAESGPDGMASYYGATGDFNLGEAGRNAIDIYKVTLPPAPRPAAGPGVGDGPTGGGPPAADERCSNVVVGTEKSNRLVGSNFGDTIRGRRGNDRIAGGLGDDCIFGGKGKDTLRGQQGDDLIKGGKGRDRIHGAAGSDDLVGGKGRDVVRGGGGDDRIKGGKGRDVVRGGGGDDRIKGGKGRDRAVGGKGDDRINARGGGRDRVKCGGGEDVARVDKRDRVSGCERVARR